MQWPSEALAAVRPTTIFWSAEPEGRSWAPTVADAEWTDGKAARLSPTATSSAADWTASASGRGCKPVSRPTVLDANVDVRIVEGAIQAFRRPEGMLKAQQRVFYAYAST